MGVWVNLTAKHLCGALTDRTTIHALDGRRMAATMRTVCGSDVFPVVWKLANRPGDHITAPWPPPRDQRCPDCVAATGRAGRGPADPHWSSLVEATP